MKESFQGLLAVSFVIAMIVESVPFFSESVEVSDVNSLPVRQ